MGILVLLLAGRKGVQRSGGGALRAWGRCAERSAGSHGRRAERAVGAETGHGADERRRLVGRIGGAARDGSGEDVTTCR